MVTTKYEERLKDQWCLDSRFSSHMTRRKYWFVNISTSMKNKVKFTNDNTLAAEGIVDVLIMRKDGKSSVISNVLYIPCMKRNLLSIWKLIKKNYKVLIEYKIMKFLDSSDKSILKESMPFKHKLRD